MLISHAAAAVLGAGATVLLTRTTHRYRQETDKQRLADGVEPSDGLAGLSPTIPTAFEGLQPEAAWSADASSETPSQLECGDPAVVPFSDWAASQILGITELTPEARQQQMFEALKTIAALYLRADVQGIMDVINIYRLTKVMLSYITHTLRHSSSLTALDLTLTRCDGLPSPPPPRFSITDVVEDPRLRRSAAMLKSGSVPAKSRYSQGDALLPDADPGRASCGAHTDLKPRRRVVNQQLAWQRQHHEYAHVCASRKMFGYLMQELEAMLTTYFSRRWNDIDAVLDANSLDLRDDGLVCLCRRDGRLCLPPTLSVSSMESSGSGSEADRSVHGGAATRGIQAGERIGGSANDVSGERASSRGARNWRRAYKVVMKTLALKLLKPAREFKTLHQMLRALNKEQAPRRPGQQPLLLFLGGGMAAGKSTVREIIGSDLKWSTIGSDAVIIEADAIKSQDVVLNELMKRGVFLDGANASEFVHEWSTKQAESMLVTAINQQKDIIFDGTCSWAPFVEQTIAMVRDHRHDYTLGPGYCHDGDSVVENYWVPTGRCTAGKQPYRIELIGVTCNAALAVARGVWRKLRTGRGVPIRAQLRSFKLFAANWEKYCGLVDSATLYHTGSELTTMNKDASAAKPSVIAHVSESTRGEMLVNPRAYPEFMQQAHLDMGADCEGSLYPHDLLHTEHVMRKPKQVQEHASVLASAFRYGQQHKLV